MLDLFVRFSYKKKCLRKGGKYMGEFEAIFYVKGMSLCSQRKKESSWYEEYICSFGIFGDPNRLRIEKIGFSVEDESINEIKTKALKDLACFIVLCNTGEVVVREWMWPQFIEILVAIPVLICWESYGRQSWDRERELCGSLVLHRHSQLIIWNFLQKKFLI